VTSPSPGLNAAARSAVTGFLSTEQELKAAANKEMTAPFTRLWFEIVANFWKKGNNGMVVRGGLRRSYILSNPVVTSKFISICNQGLSNVDDLPRLNRTIGLALSLAENITEMLVRPWATLHWRTRQVEPLPNRRRIPIDLGQMPHSTLRTVGRGNGVAPMASRRTAHP
jgi:hypothetical protein